MITSDEDVISYFKSSQDIIYFLNLIYLEDFQELYLAGGAVRSFILDTYSKDFDLFYKGDISRSVRKLESKGNLVKGPFGSLRWKPFNSEKYFDIISIVNFNNGVENCSTITDVLNQFDITINCFAVSLNFENFIGNQLAIEDVALKQIRLVIFYYPDENISETVMISRISVLWFRLLHYAALFNFEIETHTKEWLILNRHFYKDLEDFERFFFKPLISKKIFNDLNF